MLTSQAKWKQCTKMIIATAAAQRNRTFFFLREKYLDERNIGTDTALRHICLKSVLALINGVCGVLL